MTHYSHIYYRIILLVTMSLVSTKAIAQKNSQLVRLAIIEVDTAHLDVYNEFLKE
jgi:hypothetical protein